jgi:hypothetical protein
MEHFTDDDPGYLRWLADNPDGFVLNTERTPRPTYLMLHRATCHTITRPQPRATNWTRDYVKFCGTRAELETHARHTIGGEPHPCRLCHRQ